MTVFIFNLLQLISMGIKILFKVLSGEKSLYFNVRYEQIKIFILTKMLGKIIHFYLQYSESKKNTYQSNKFKSAHYHRILNLINLTSLKK